VDVKDIAEEVIGLFQTSFRAKGIGFTIDTDERLVEKIKIDFQRVC
jgi:hypothetical protein